MAPSKDGRRALLLAATEIADRAAALVMEIYGTEFSVRRKGDSSPVTEADERAEDLILPALRELIGGAPAIGEESVARGARPQVGDGPFWLVDPLDGTKEFVSRNGEFTVNVALVENRSPVLGVVLAPAAGVGFRACGAGTAEKRGTGGEWTPIRARRIPANGAVVVSSRSHGDRRRIAEMLRGAAIDRHRLAGSSLKFCLVAEGTADVYPRYGGTSEWDTAAGQAVLDAAGGSVRTLDGDELRYGKPGWRNPEFVARGLE